MRGPLLEETHYYPFGLTMAGISSKAAGKLENRFKFNGYEQQGGEFSDDTGLEWYDYKRRFYDNQLGRFFTQDQLADTFPHYSPYQFAGNEVPNAIDLDGREPLRQHIINGVRNWWNDFNAGKGKTYAALDWVNRNLNPVGMLAHGAYQTTTGKDMITGKNVSRLDGFNSMVAGAFSLYTMFYSAAISGAKGLQAGASGLEISGSSNTTKYAFDLTAKEGNLELYSTKVGDNILEFGGEFVKSDGVLTIKNFDIDGGMTNKLGVNGIREIMNAFGKAQDVTKIIIQGAPRTTGANPGKITTLTFEIK